MEDLTWLGMQGRYPEDGPSELRPEDERGKSRMALVSGLHSALRRRPRVPVGEGKEGEFCSGHAEQPMKDRAGGYVSWARDKLGSHRCVHGIRGNSPGTRTQGGRARAWVEV